MLDPEDYSDPWARLNNLDEALSIVWQRQEHLSQELNEHDEILKSMLASLQQLAKITSDLSLRLQKLENKSMTARPLR